MFTVLRAYQMHYILPKTDVGETSDGEFKLFRIRKFDNDDVDGKPDSTDEDTQVSKLQHWPVSGVMRTLVAS